MLTISVAHSDEYGTPVKPKQTFIQILDNVGRVVWPTSLISRNESSFMRMISTKELKRGRRYMIKIANNHSMIYMTYGYFQTNRWRAIIPLLIIPGAIIPQIVKEKLRGPREEEKGTPKYLVYRTELDSRVCKICKPHEGRVFSFHAKDIIRIGPPDLGGDTHWNCRCFYVPYGLKNPALEIALMR